MKKLSLVIAAAICGMTAAAALGQRSAMGMRHGSASPKQGLSPLDKSFLKDTAQSNLGELKYPPVVEKMAQRPESRQYAQKMVQDHSRAQQQLKSLAAQVSYNLPSDTDQEEKEIIHRLSRESKTSFDAAYKHEMIRDHTGDIAKTRREISLGRNPQVIAFAEQMLPILQTHLKLARALPSGGV